MRKRISLLFAIVMYCFSVSAQQDSKPKKFILNGKIIGRNTGLVWLSYYDKNGNEINDTTYLKNGNFSFSGFINEPTGALIGGLNKSTHTDDPNIRVLYIEPPSMQIKLKENDFKDAEITGSKTQIEKDTLDALPIAKKLTAIVLEIDDINKRIRQGDTSVILKNKWQALKNAALIYSRQKKEIEYTFIISHPRSYLSPGLVNYYFQEKELSLDSARIFYSSLDPLVKQSNDAEYLNSLIKAKEVSAVGSAAPEFKKTDINGKEVSLGVFKGKSYILLDFWASWCVPCRELTPYLKSVYTKYHLRGLDIISIAVIDKEKAWKKAVADDNMIAWPNIFDNKNISLKTKYHVGLIPTIILIDKNGNIAGRYVGQGGQDQDDLNEKLEEIFN